MPRESHQDLYSGEGKCEQVRTHDIVYKYSCAQSQQCEHDSKSQKSMNGKVCVARRMEQQGEHRQSLVA